MFFERFLHGGNSFEQTYRCYPSSFIDKPNLEAGDKVIMAPSALDRLAFLHIQYPMLFELHNDATDRISHCGVLEFIAEEGMIYMPYWMMQNMLLKEGDVVRVKNATLPKGTYVKLQPHTMDFLDISNPKAILETTLRNFSCLTTGDSIMVAYNNKQYYIDIIETKPAPAISIIETDCEVDFAPPLDYKEPVKPSINNAQTTGAPVEREPEPKFTPFTGGGMRLDGKPTKQQVTPATTPAKNLPVGPDRKQQNTAAGSSKSGGPIRKKAGTLVFGSSTNSSSLKGTQKGAAKEKEPVPEPTKKEETKFQSFTGKKYTLKG
ncbi:uncharacterized protein LOC144558406 isoform X2 [Carex rostrata]